METANDVKVTHHNDTEHTELKALQSIKSFGMGTITIQTTFSLRIQMVLI